MIEVKNLVKRFGDTLAVDGLSFQASEGEILGFLGPNGAGKTTTMRVITGFYPPTRGSVSLGGIDVGQDPLAASRLLGYLPESVPLYANMRVGEYLRFVAGAKGIKGAAAAKEAVRVAELVGVGPRRGQLIGQLSKGFKQRVGLAQALLGDPPALILDEPTIGLDPVQIVEIRQLIKSFAGNKTVVLSSHILPEVAATCNRVIIINQGKLVAEGAPDMLTAPGGGGLLRVTCVGDKEKLVKLMGEVPGVSSLTDLPDPPAMEGAHSFKVELEGGPAANAALAKAVVQAECQLIEMTPVSATLEDVFMQLTTRENQKEEEAA